MGYFGGPLNSVLSLGRARSHDDCPRSNPERVSGGDLSSRTLHHGWCGRAAPGRGTHVLSLSGSGPVAGGTVQDGPVRVVEGNGEHPFAVNDKLQATGDFERLACRCGGWTVQRPAENPAYGRTADSSCSVDSRRLESPDRFLRQPAGRLARTASLPRLEDFIDGALGYGGPNQHHALGEGGRHRVCSFLDVCPRQKPQGPQGGQTLSTASSDCRLGGGKHGVAKGQALPLALFSAALVDGVYPALESGRIAVRQAAQIPLHSQNLCQFCRPVARNRVDGCRNRAQCAGMPRALHLATHLPWAIAGRGAAQTNFSVRISRRWYQPLDSGCGERPRKCIPVISSLSKYHPAGGRRDGLVRHCVGKTAAGPTNPLPPGGFSAHRRTPPGQAGWPQDVAATVHRFLLRVSVLALRGGGSARCAPAASFSERNNHVLPR